ncbi:MAG: NADPH:quinone reductase [Cytophagales bacterium]|nr:MAG: NADPH:quinone reductase [Cytophagales bacterium]
MQQVQFSEYGGAEVLQIVTVDKPQPQAGQVLIRVEAAGVNYSDILRRKNTYFMPTPLPFVLGTEAVGEIVAVGEGVVDPPFQVGNRVLAILPQGGGYAEYALAATQFCVPLPPTLDAAEATAIFVQGSTAYLMLYEVVKDLANRSVLIHAAAGGVGSILVQLAKLAGAATVIGTASTDEKCAVARSRGADYTVNYTNSGWADRVISANGGNKVDLILEMVGGEIYAQSFACLATGGTMVVYGAASGQKGFMHSEHFVDENQTVTGFNLAWFIQNRMAQWQQALGAVIGLMAEGKLRIHVQDSFPLQAVVDAHTRIENRQTTGKVVLKP